MARKAPDRNIVHIELAGLIDTIEGSASVDVWTNFPLKHLAKLDSGQMTAVIEFLSMCIVKWDGFDMELSAESISELTSDEARQLVDAIMTGLGPQRGKSTTSP